MRILMIYRVNVADTANAGVHQKMTGMADALRRLDHQVSSIYQDGSDIAYMGTSRPISMRPRWYGQLTWYHAVESMTKDEEYDLLIIRYGLSTPSFISFLKKYKALYPKTKVVIDMPTYPYVMEWGGISGWLAMQMDQYYARQLHEYVDLMTHSGSEARIHGIPTLRMTNGIDPHAFSKKKLLPEGETIQMIAVGKWQYWHGLDRVIAGLDDYSGDMVHLHIVGDGPALTDIRAMVKELDLEKMVILHGPMIGEGLDRLFDRCHIAIGTLGIHRKGVTIDSSLKHREYCTRGIPFILSSADLDFDSSLEWVHYVSVSDAPIDIHSLTNWYRKLDINEVTDQMRHYALEQLTWDSRMDRLLKQMG